ncbi:AAA family ATPase [Candidatus Uhrbacteria bacterium RIFCSPHIGHO2_12_FULL_54_23]|uniref:AAA family ATPase n=2 Tax=Candidatus Uhriibacteriota TaxID=1752732 RepID=A0A1F7UP57_9BACT|nr:MAG: AAA family ATPase [Candidatus Uhrbacteria bacterium RIFCSPHIGHO2_12_FULL_54_23]OGL85003.1 MAG: AAA family ATPase [Candidatus Uhrbacteria bacterium RIFCSPLOWO2_01_FULL_55_36]
MFLRLQHFVDLGSESCFLWGPRQCGKSTLLKQKFPHSPYYDLLLSNEFERLNRRPSLLREELIAQRPTAPVIIDEVQKIPHLLDEIQWLMVNKKIQFVLCGSSARKLKRGGGNLLGGRALRYELFPLVSAEIPGFDLTRALNHGCLPRHYVSRTPELLGRSYVGDYLKEEIAAEALTRNVPAFARFLEAAAFSNGEIMNFTNIARECGVSGPTVREYFQILEDTLIARFVSAFQKKPKRRVIRSPKFYLFDVGIANVLLKRGAIKPGSEIFGRAFEHFILQEIIAHRHYASLEYPVSYWRTASGLEVDFILGDREIALEIKGTQEVQPHHLRGLKAFQEEYQPKHAIAVSLDAKPRETGGISIMPWKEFLGGLWAGSLIH